MEPPERSCPPPTRKRDREATSQALLCAAREVFARKGFDAATTREIADEAGVNEGLIQRYFGGKGGLLFAILGDSDADHAHCRGGIPEPQATAQEEIAAWLRHQIRHLAEHAELQRVAMCRALVDEEVARRWGTRTQELWQPLIRERLEGLARQGRVAADADLDAAAHVVATLGYGLGFTEQLVFGVDAARLDPVVEAAARALALGLAPRAG